MLSITLNYIFHDLKDSLMLCVFNYGRWPNRQFNLRVFVSNPDTAGQLYHLVIRSLRLISYPFINKVKQEKKKHLDSVTGRELKPYSLAVGR